ncbi:hypothetical protein TCON_2111 [Astathelohania contejeani]|uniref:Uncharacterized protein n=1 Tax=Astathelohania contejeani TaxID=164912 RepID=A0ABQ7HWY8_9MICR|nr:hypothetical protein TCON_2111 [Thelohania contejeani]
MDHITAASALNNQPLFSSSENYLNLLGIGDDINLNIINNQSPAPTSVPLLFSPLPSPSSSLAISLPTLLSTPPLDQQEQQKEEEEEQQQQDQQQQRESSLPLPSPPTSLHFPHKDGSSLYGHIFNAKLRNNNQELQRYLLKMYIQQKCSPENNNNDEMAKFIYEFGKQDLSNMDDEELKNTVKMIAMVQNILYDQSDIKDFFQLFTNVSEQIRDIALVKYPRYLHSINMVFKKFIHTLQRIENNKNEHVEKLLRLLALDLKDMKYCQPTSSNTIIINALIQTGISLIMFGIIELINNHGKVQAEYEAKKFFNTGKIDDNTEDEIDNEIENDENLDEGNKYPSRKKIKHSHI